MAPLTTVYTEPIVQKYRAPRLSSANLWRLFSYPVIALLTLLITFSTQGLWRRTNNYLEQPTIEFREKIFFLFQCQSGKEEKDLGWNFFWSPFEHLNDRWSNRLAWPAVETHVNEFNSDWKADELSIQIAFQPPQMKTFANCSSVFYALFFDVRLEQRALLQLWSAPIFGQIDSMRSFDEVSVLGDLEFVQMEPLPWYGNLSVDSWNPIAHTLLGNTTTNSTESMNEEVDGAILFDQLSQQLHFWALNQNFTVGLGRKVELRRISGRNFNSSNSNSTSAASRFKFNFNAKIRTQILQYRTSGWELLKWAWIQYMAMLMIVRSLFNIISAFLYQNQIFGTFVISEQQKDEKCKKS